MNGTGLTMYQLVVSGRSPDVAGASRPWLNHMGRLRRGQRLSKAIGHLARGARVEIALGRRDPGVTHRRLDGRQIDATGDEERAVGVAEIVEP